MLKFPFLYILKASISQYVAYDEIERFDIYIYKKKRITKSIDMIFTLM